MIAGYNTTRMETTVKQTIGFSTKRTKQSKELRDTLNIRFTEISALLELMQAEMKQYKKKENQLNWADAGSVRAARDHLVLAAQAMGAISDDEVNSKYGILF